MATKKTVYGRSSFDRGVGTMDWQKCLADLDSNLLSELLIRSTKRVYLGGVTLYEPGERPRGIHLVESGQVVIQSTPVAGAAVGLEVIGPGGVFGEHAIDSGSPDHSSAQTSKPTSLYILMASDFEALRREFPHIDQFVIRLLQDRVRSLTTNFGEAVNASAEERLCRRLYLLGVASDNFVEISQKSLALLAGTTRPTVNRVLQNLAKSGLVQLQRSRIQVLDPAGLSARAF